MHDVHIYEQIVEAHFLKGYKDLPNLINEMKKSIILVLVFGLLCDLINLTS